MKRDMLLRSLKRTGDAISVACVASVLFAFSAHAVVVEQSLEGQWRLAFATNATEVIAPIEVPGGVHSALLKAGRMKDTYYGRNELDTQWVAKEDWAIARSFEVSPELLAHKKVILRLEDCDTFCQVFVNGVKVGETTNRFRRWDFDVKPYLKVGTNEIRGVFASAWRIADERARETPGKCHMSNVPWCKNQALIRKPACHAGWDWGPAQMITGFCGPVKLIASDGDRIDYIRTRQIWTDDLSHCKLIVIAWLEDGTQESRVLEIDNPPLWWPNGAGEQNFYTYTVEIRGQQITRRIGLRKLEVITAGGALTFRVNNRDLFMKGASWIPCDMFENRQTSEKYRDLLESAASANMNMIRLWGGGQYEKDVFYDLCDELGLLVWHDFMFSCAVYPGDQAFLDDIAAEFAHQVRRLADHASIALWCGDNECVGALNWYGDPPEVVAINRANLEKRQAVSAAAVAKYDPDRMFWPSSPCAGPGDYSDAWHDDSKGDMHNWTVWHENKGFENYYNYRPRFCSEFGYQSFPSREIAETFCPADELNPTAPDFDWHQKNAGGNARMLETMARYFRFPQGTDAILYLSQIQQAIAMKTAVENWRAQRPRCSGTLFWQLNDCWPVASWSSIEYGGKWKPLQYFARRFFAPLAVVAVPSTNGNVKVVGFNDTFAPVAAELAVTYYGFDESAAIPETRAVTLPPNSVTELGDYAPKAESFLALQLKAGDSVFNNEWFFDAFKNHNLAKAKITTSISAGTEPNTFDVALTTDKPAFFVWANVKGIRGEFDDNAFTLLPNVPHKLRYTAKEPLTEEAFRRAFSLTHLRETY